MQTDLKAELRADLETARRRLEAAREVQPINDDAAARWREHVRRLEHTVRYLELLVGAEEKHAAAQKAGE